MGKHKKGMYTVLIIGRANVGKSSLFNKIVGRRNALVSKLPGTTRDTNWARVTWNKRTFLLGDSAGLEDLDPRITRRKFRKNSVHGNLQNLVERKVLGEIKDANERILVCDGETGLVPQDKEIFQFLKKKGYSFIVVVNKIDGAKDQTLLTEFHALNVPFFATSAASGIGINDLLDSIIEQTPETTEPEIHPRTIRVALLGKPNVGKSTLLNALTKTDSMITSHESHTTREPHTVELPINDSTKLLLTDTAGIRRKSRISEFVEIAGVRMSLKTMETVDVVLFVIDFLDPDSAQDKALARLIAEQKKPCIIVANKYDLLQAQLSADPNATPLDRQGLLAHVEKQIRGRFPFLKYAPILSISALTTYRIHETTKVMVAVFERAHARIPDLELDSFLARTLKKQPPPIVGVKKRRARALGIFQNERRLSEFIFQVKSKDPVPMHYIQFMEKELRASFDFTGIPITLTVEKV